MCHSYGFSPVWLLWHTVKGKFQQKVFPPWSTFFSECSNIKGGLICGWRMLQVSTVTLLPYVFFFPWPLGEVWLVAEHIFMKFIKFRLLYEFPNSWNLTVCRDSSQPLWRCWSSHSLWVRMHTGAVNFERGLLHVYAVSPVPGFSYVVKAALLWNIFSIHCGPGIASKLEFFDTENSLPVRDFDFDAVPPGPAPAWFSLHLLSRILHLLSHPLLNRIIRMLPFTASFYNIKIYFKRLWSRLVVWEIQGKIGLEEWDRSVGA